MKKGGELDLDHSKFCVFSVRQNVSKIETVS